MKALDINIQTKDLSFASLPTSLPSQIHDLALNANARISGPMSEPIITADASIAPQTSTQDNKIKISAKGHYDKNQMRIDLTGSGDGIKKVDGQVKIPFKLSLQPFMLNLNKTTPLNGSFTLNADTKVLAQTFLPVGHELTGDIKSQIKLSGTVETPNITGSTALKNGSYIFNTYGIKLFNFNIDSALNSETIELKNLNADDGQGGIINAKGQINFKHPKNTKVNLNITNFKLLDSEKANGTISANLNFQGHEQNPLLSGDINLGKCNIAIPEQFQSTIPSLNIVEKSQNNSTIPQFNGTFSSKSGRYEEFGRKFQLTNAALRFQGNIPPSPYLDITATTDADDINASLNLTGAINKPSIELSSIPALPEDEIMSHILFGDNVSKITPFQAIKLKTTLDRLTGKGGDSFDPLGQLRGLTGLDDIRVETDDDGAASIGVGKYITEKVYLELEKGAGETSGAAKIQVEVTPNISLESEVGQDAQAGAGILWKWDY